MHFPYNLAIVLEPPDGFFQSVAQAMASLKAEELLGPAHVETSTRLAVRLGGIPLNLSGKANLGRDHAGKITDCNLFTRS